MNGTASPSTASSSRRCRLALFLLVLSVVPAVIGQRVVVSSPSVALLWFLVAVVFSAFGTVLHGREERRFLYPTCEQLQPKKAVWFVPPILLAVCSLSIVANGQWGKQIPAVLWILSIATLLLPFWISARQSSRGDAGASRGDAGGNASVNQERDTRTWIAVSVILFIAFILRFVELERFPLAVHNDEANCGLMAQQILAEWREGGVDWFRIRDFYLFNTIGFVPSAFFQAWFPPSLFGHRLANVVWSMGALFLFYLLMRDLFGKLVGLVALFLAATAHFSIHWSRSGIHCGHVAFLAAMCMWILWKGVSTGRYRWFALLGIILPFCGLTYGAAQVIPVTLGLVLGAYWLLSRDFRRAYTRPLVVVVIAAAVTCAPFVPVYMKAPHALASRGSSMVWTDDASSIRHMKSVHGEQYLANTIKFNAEKSALLFNSTADRNAQYGFRSGGILDTVTAPIFMVGLGVMLPKLLVFTHWPFILFIVLNVVLGSVMTLNPAEYGRLAGISFVMGIPTALWAREVYNSARGAAGKLGGIIAAVCLIAFLIAVAGKNFDLYFVKYDLARGDAREAQIHLIAEDVATRGPTNKTFVLKGEFPTDFNFQSHRFMAYKLPAQEFTTVEQVVFPPEENITSITVIVPLKRTDLIEALAQKYPSGITEVRHLSYRDPSDFYSVFTVPLRVAPVG